MLHTAPLNVRREGNYVRLDDAEEVIGWCQAFGCTAAQLRQAVAAVGPAIADVYRYLRALT
ncbi:DUF3606 domain-containing protein [Hymenobacter ruricola]|uniref:DUF3606 domain-containing protein n=1 Tax=Hymenobacter ruricola TaxID=2791023 RepID=A0ABS0I8B3_9BACT|nr:DUF3606 domain-containing protein [Hymenobacter ruricola]MBF9223011.1 DUF3606 domain-containing protein [Hymenobacter ruricola]